jgi:hypothetical protein
MTRPIQFCAYFTRAYHTVDPIKITCLVNHELEEQIVLEIENDHQWVFLNPNRHYLTKEGVVQVKRRAQHQQISLAQRAASSVLHDMTCMNQSTKKAGFDCYIKKNYKSAAFRRKNHMHKNPFHRLRMDKQDMQFALGMEDYSEFYEREALWELPKINEYYNEVKTYSDDDDELPMDDYW